jgi:hypothetical protein
LTNFANNQQIEFKVDRDNLYREEGLTDMKTASIRRLVPIKADGSPDTSRTEIFVGSTQLMTPEGPLPIQARLMANNLSEAFDEFPSAMQQALNEVIDELQKMQQQRKNQKRDSSRIIVPGR